MDVVAELVAGAAFGFDVVSEAEYGESVVQ